MPSAASSLWEALSNSCYLTVAPILLALQRNLKWINHSNSTYPTIQGCSWKFNPPHASHMGGSWECMIGVARRILDSMLLQNNVQLTHNILCTLMAEFTTITRPLVPVSSDAENPFILSPSMLLTQKSCLLPPPGDFTDKDLYNKQWRQVQALFNQFWTRWRREYLPTLQQRQWVVQKPPSWWPGSVQGQAGCTKQLAHGQCHCYIPKQGRSSKENWGKDIRSRVHKDIYATGCGSYPPHAKGLNA